MQKIVPHLWFDKEAVKAAQFYTKVFPNTKITHQSRITDTPSGDCDIVGFSIDGYSFMSVSAGPYFKINPALSFHIKCKSVGEVDDIWKKLEPEGKVLMPLDAYPFSKRYGWIEDKFGVSWQIIHVPQDFKSRITPVIMYTQDLYGRAEEAGKYYASVFDDSKFDVVMRYSKEQAPEKEGKIAYSMLIIEGQEFGLMESANEHKFKLSEAVSLMINCRNQKEIDYFWDKLSAIPESEQCGWVKDKYGVSWQIIPSNMGELISSPEATQAMLGMKKINIEKLKSFSH